MEGNNYRIPSPWSLWPSSPGPARVLRGTFWTGARIRDVVPSCWWSCDLWGWELLGSLVQRSQCAMRDNLPEREREEWQPWAPVPPSPVPRLLVCERYSPGRKLPRAPQLHWVAFLSFTVERTWPVHVPVLCYWVLFFLGQYSQLKKNMVERNGLMLDLITLWPSLFPIYLLIYILNRAKISLFSVTVVQVLKKE